MSSASAAIRAALRGYEPSAEQWDVIRAPLEPVAIVAGAGSGKTAVMTARIVHLVEQGQVRPAQVLGLTFTNKAAGELEERLSEALMEMEQAHIEHATVLTYNAFAAKIVREHAARIGVDPEAGLMSQAHKWQMLMNLVDDFPSFDALELRHPLSFIPQAINLADQCANHLVTPDDLEAECARMDKGGDDWIAIAARKRRDYAHILRLYIAEKRKRRRIDFGDQITFAVEILERFEDVTKELREHWPVVLLDEYQDTNPAQKVMLQRICPHGSAVTAVGDARQAIYGWRGASMFNLINFHLEFPMADGSPAHQASLSENFRSGSRIVSLANRVIDRVPEEHRPGADLIPVKANGEGWVGAALFTDEGAEAEFIADEIERLHDDGREWRDMAILVRAKRFMDAIVGVLEERDIPVEMPELGGLLKIPAVLDTVAWLRVLSDPGPQTNRWLARILMGPRYRIHYRDLAPIARHAVHKTYDMLQAAKDATGQDEPDPGEIAYSLLEALDDADGIEGVSEPARERIAEFLALVAELRRRVSQPLVELVQAVVERTGIGDAIAASTSRTAAAMHENLHAVLGVCSEFAPLEGEANLGTFLDYLDIAEESEDAVPVAASAGSDSVKLMTVHGAKGLEFDTVFLPVLAASDKVNRWDGTRQGSVFPDVRSSNPFTSTTQLPPGVRRDAQYLPTYTGNMSAYRRELRQRAEEDERRLFYVAITRAKQRLYCSAAHWYGADERKGPSEFLDEMFAHADVVEELRRDEAPDENPIAASMRRDLRWPPRQAQVADDVGVWLQRLDALVADESSPDDLLDTVDGARAVYEEHRHTIERLSAVSGVVAAAARARSLSATAAVRIALSKEPSDTVLSPLPERPTDAQRLGIAVHAWIEERNRGLLGLAEEEALDEASLAPDAETVERLKANFASMGYAERQAAELDSGEPMTELPFTLKVASILVRGRIDAVYPSDAGLEIVDFKTGRIPDEPEWGQLELYAEALSELGYVKGEVALTYAYLQDAKRVTKTYTPQGVSWLEAALGA